MLSNVKVEAWEPRTILSALAAWAISALILLCIASLILSKISLGEGAMGYVSSALSFLSAVFAGAALGRAKSGGIIYPALLTAAVLVTALLTIGFIVEGADLQSSGVLSVVSFTFSGCLLGAVLSGGKKTRSHKKRYRK